MKITLCGSLAFFETMQKVASQLEALGHEVKMPPVTVDDGLGGQISAHDRYQACKEANADEVWIWDMREQAMRNHFDKVAWADAIVVTNFEKKGVPGYIGANTLLEMGLAFHLKKPIYLMFKVPDLDYQEEILGMKPTVIENFSQI